MGLIDDGLRPRDVGRPVVSPIEHVVAHHRLQHALGAVAAVIREIGPWRIDAIAEERVVAADPAGKAPRIGVDQELVRIEAVPGLRVIWPVHDNRRSIRCAFGR
jgi:hypothetical protein